MRFAKLNAVGTFAGLCLFAFAATALAQPVSSGGPADPFAATAAENGAKPFTGALTVRQKGGGLYYKVFFVEGQAVGGFSSWRGTSGVNDRIVGGWYVGDRMTLLIQSTRNNVTDKWFSHAHHFRKQDKNFTLEQTLYGDGKTIDSGEVYQPHEIDEEVEMPAEEARRQAEDAKPDGAPETDKQDESGDATEKADADERAASGDDAKTWAERENSRLKKLVAELLLENDSLKRRLSRD